MNPIDENVFINDNIKTTFSSDNKPLKMEYLKTGIIVEYKYDKEGNCIEERDNSGFIKQMNTDGATVYLKGINGIEEWFDNETGKLSRRKYSDGRCWKYNDNGKGKVIHYKKSNGFECSYEYDEYGNKYYKDNRGYEKWYNSKGKIIHLKRPTGYEYWKKYNEYGKCVHYKKSNGFECSYEYDDKGNLTYIKYPSREEWYDDKGNLTHIKCYGEEIWYDKKGNLTHYKHPNGKEKWYDDKGNLTHIKYPSGGEEWYEYKQNKRTYSKTSEGKEVWYDNEKIIRVKTEEDIEYNVEYDKHGELIRIKGNDIETWFDEHGVPIFSRTPDNKDDDIEKLYIETMKDRLPE